MRRTVEQALLDLRQQVAGWAERPRAGVFIYGRHDAATRSFVFDPERVAALRRLTVDEAPRCARCFAKYHCAGDCPSKRLFAGADEAVVGRCEINRALTLDQLEEVLR